MLMPCADSALQNAAIYNPAQYKVSILHTCCTRATHVQYFFICALVNFPPFTDRISSVALG